LWFNRTHENPPHPDVIAWSTREVRQAEALAIIGPLAAFVLLKLRQRTVVIQAG
jgi:hypothetical protein